MLATCVSPPIFFANADGWRAQRQDREITPNLTVDT
jgi:hypothetical protein